MSGPNDHAEYLRRADYPVPEGGPLGKEQAALLRRYGHWLEALATGAVEPATAEQAHFVAAARGEAEARTEFERAWALLRDHREPAPVLFDRLAEARARAEHLRQEKEAERERILERVRADLDAVEERYAGELEEAGRELQAAEDALRAEVLLSGQSVKHPLVHAVYCRGRVTWDGEGLARLAESEPAILEYRKVGAPTVQLRYQRPKE